MTLNTTTTDNSGREEFVQIDLNDATTTFPQLRQRRKKIERDKTKASVSDAIVSLVPILKWLPMYNFADNLLHDILSGITVAIMHIPQGMAYSLLGNVPAVTGIYMAFFPVLIYILFGTSRHVSMGTFAVVCLMTGKIVVEQTSVETTLDPTAVAATVTFTVAIILFFLYLFRLGSLCCLLTDSLVSGFTTGCAVLVMVSQLRDILNVPRYNDRHLAFQTLYTLRYLVSKWPDANMAALTISLVTMVILDVSNRFIKPRIERKLNNFPFPSELLAIIIGTICSRYYDFSNLFKIRVVGNIPTGLPRPQMPIFAIVPHIIVDCLVIAIVSYTITISMALIFAKKSRYEIRTNQELFAMGASNMFGSFFSCMPFAASLSRSMIQFTSGGRTQMASLVSCSLLLTVLLWIGPEFEKLPRCILASIIIVALQGMFAQARCLRDLWKRDRKEAWVWLVTFGGVVTFDIGSGLACGIICALGNVIFPIFRPYACLLERAPNTKLFLDSNYYEKLETIDNLRIFRYFGSLIQINRNHFKKQLFTHVPWLKEPLSVAPIERQRYLILDCTAIGHIDQAAIDLLAQLRTEMNERTIDFIIVGVSGHLQKQFTIYSLTKANASAATGAFKMFFSLDDALKAMELPSFQ